MGQLPVTALAVFLACCGAVSLLGFKAARWRAGDLTQLLEWGLGGRRFGTIIVWFLLGGDLYTTYTLIAVPALVYSVGAYGFFALPSAVMAYPMVFILMPLLWEECRAHQYLTVADFVHGRYASRGLALAVALTGILALMPYIALQLVGLQTVLGALGLSGPGWRGDLALIIAFLVLSVFTYTSGLRAPAMIAMVKDLMIFIVVLAAVLLIPLQLGGYGAVFAAANAAFTAKGSGGLLLTPAQMLPFATVALGSGCAVFFYPHATTALLSSSSAAVIRRNAMLLPLYSLLLGLIALLGYMALAAGVSVSDRNMVVPALFIQVFPPWFTGFSFAAIAIGALVPAAIMSIGAANLFTRNIWRAFVNPRVPARQEAAIAKLVSLLVKAGALLFIIVLPTQFAVDLQLLGGVWILQTFPAIALGLTSLRLDARALLPGWAVGMASGSGMALSLGVKPVFPLTIGGQVYGVYVGLLALALNLAVAAAAQIYLSRRR